MHDHPRCGAHTRSGGPCGNRAGQRTEHEGTGRCWLHGGRGIAEQPQSPTMQAYTSAQAAASLSRLGFEAAGDADPEKELLRQVALAASRVDALAYQHRMAQQTADTAEDPKAKRQAQLQVAATAMVYDAERFNSAKISAMALKAGVARRKVELAERQGAMIYTVLVATLQQLGLPPQQIEDARGIIAGEFRRLSEQVV